MIDERDFENLPQETGQSSGDVQVFQSGRQTRGTSRTEIRIDSIPHEIGECSIIGH